MDIAAVSPLKVFLKNDLFSDVVLHVYKINNNEEDSLKMESLSEALDEGCTRKKRKCPYGKSNTLPESCPPSVPSPPCTSATTSTSQIESDKEETMFPISSLPPSDPPETHECSSYATLKELGPLHNSPIFSSLPIGSHAEPVRLINLSQPSLAPLTPPTDAGPISSTSSSLPVTTGSDIPPIPSTLPLAPCTSTSSASSSSSRDILPIATPSTACPPCPDKNSSTTTTVSTTTSTTITSTTPSSTPPSTTITATTTKASSPTPTISLNGHRCVLAAHSKFFYAMFSSGMKESFEREVKVYVEDVQTFEKMFEYFYTGIIDFKNTQLLQLLELCLQFDVSRLCCDVSSYLSANLTPGNAFEVYEFARSRLEKNNILAAKTYEFVLNYFFPIFRGYPESICNLSYSSLRDLLKSDKLNVSMEYYAFMALRYWSEHTNAKDCEIREILPCIRFSQIDVDRLRNLVRTSKLGVACPEMYRCYMDAVEYHAAAPDIQPYLSICDDWRRKREHYKSSEFVSFTWKLKWSGITSWVYNWTHLQGYKLFATLGKHDDGTFGMYFVPSANEQKQFCLKAELKVYLTNKDNAALCPELKLEPTIFKSDAKTPLNSIAKGWATKIQPAMLINDTIVMRIKARICD